MIMSEEKFRKQLADATRRDKEAEKHEPFAKSARYERRTNRLRIDLTNGTTFIIPCNLIEGLQNADPALLAEVEILGRGYALHWETLDQDYTVADLVAGIFGRRAWMQELGRHGGSQTSEAKRAAVRENGRLGGRPRKSKAS